MYLKTLFLYELHLLAIFEISNKNVLIFPCLRWPVFTSADRFSVKCMKTRGPVVLTQG